MFEISVSEFRLLYFNEKNAIEMVFLYEQLPDITQPI